MFETNEKNMNHQDLESGKILKIVSSQKINLKSEPCSFTTINTSIIKKKCKIFFEINVFGYQ